MGRGSGVLLLAAVLGGASALAACLLPTFSDVLPGASAPDSGAPDAEDAGFLGCDDTLGAFAIWPMTEGSGDVVHDCSDKYPGTITAGGAGSVTWTDGRNGQQALQMSGGYVALVDDPALRIAGPFTVTAWISASNQQTDSFGDVIARYAAINTAAWDLTVTKDPKVSLTLFTGASIIQATGTLSYGVFAHVAATYASGTGAAEIYVDGKRIQNVQGPAALPTILTAMTFGANSVGTSVYFGKIAGIRVYKRVLSPADISTLSGH